MDLMIVITASAIICGVVALATLGVIHLIEDKEYKNYKARYEDDRI